VLWGDSETETEPIDPRTGFHSDGRTMDQLLRTIDEWDPEFVFVGLPDVDRTSHVFGPDSAAARTSLLEADRQLGRLIAALRHMGAWEHAVLVVTADHGFESIEPDEAAGVRYPLVFFGRELERAGIDGVTLVSEGGVESVFLAGAAPTTLAGATADRLRRVRALALAQPEIAEAWYRVPNPDDGGNDTTVEHVHPDWRMTSPAVGDLLLVAKLHFAFADPFRPRLGGLAGDHGGPGQGRIPIVIAGGGAPIVAQIRDAEDGTAANPDIGATAAWLLGVRMPRRLDRSPVPAELAGRVLHEAFH
jgi:arylsulfatase A-like enzyme